MLKLQCNGDLECLDEEDEEDYQGSVNSLGVIKQKIPDLSEPEVPCRPCNKFVPWNKQVSLYKPLLKFRNTY